MIGHGVFNNLPLEVDLGRQFSSVQAQYRSNQACQETRIVTSEVQVLCIRELCCPLVQLTTFCSPVGLGLWRSSSFGGRLSGGSGQLRLVF